MHRVFIAGVPGTGKTTFGDWLECNRGYFHLDMEGRLRSIQPLYSLWKQAAEGRSFSPFANELARVADKVVITWGFPPDAIALAHGIKNLGVSCWWFDAARDVARAKWLGREGHADDTYFRMQCADIDAAQEKILTLFGSNIVKVIGDDGTFIAPEVISARLKIA